MSHIARELKMLFYLNNNINRYVKIDELADLLEITPRQVRRYRDDLDQNGYFVDELRGPAGGYKLAEPLDINSSAVDKVFCVASASIQVTSIPNFSKNFKALFATIIDLLLVLSTATL